MRFTRHIRARAAVLWCFTVACDRDRSSPPNGLAAQAVAVGSAASVSRPVARRDSLERARRDSLNRARPGYVVDSILPIEEEVRRFQATVSEPPDTLAGGATSRTALVHAFVRAVEEGDARALRRLVVDRAEFGVLIYPSSPNARPPYRLSPDIVWLQRTAATEKAAARLIGRFAGGRLAYDGYTCTTPSDRQGENRVWTSCVVRRRVGSGDAATLQMFGPIVERGGRYKFLSLAGGL